MFERTALPDGPRVISACLPGARSVSIAAYVLAGSRHERADQVGAGADQRMRLVVDQAGGHCRPQGGVPAGVERAGRPAYSPAFQPAERLGPLTNEPLAHRAFPGLAALDAVLAEPCVQLAEQPERVRAQTLFHWWPRTPAMPEAFNRS